MTPVGEILVDTGPLETRVALLDGDRLVELLVERPALGGGSRAGEIVLARVRSVRGDMNTAFLDIGGGGTAVTASGGLVEGASVLVRLTADAHGQKAATAVSRIELAGTLLTLTPGVPGASVSRRITARGERSRFKALLEARLPAAVGAIVRTAATGADDDAITADLDALLAGWSAIERAVAAATPPATIKPAPDAETRARARVGTATVIRDRDGAAFAVRGIDEQIEAALHPRVPVDGGGALTIETTEALTAIDVDSAGAPTRRGRLRRLNEAAAVETARQLRLRGIGGLVLIDFPRMEGGGDRQVVEAALVAAAADDPDGVVVHGWTRAGLLEVTRTRTGPSLAEMMLDRATVVPRVEAVAAEAIRRLARARNLPARPRLVVAPPVAAAFDGPLSSALETVAERIGGVTVTGRIGYHRDRIEIEDANADG